MNEINIVRNKLKSINNLNAFSKECGISANALRTFRNGGDIRVSNLEKIKSALKAYSAKIGVDF